MRPGDGRLRARRVILTHGEDKVRDALHGIMAKRYGLDAERPALYDVIEV